MRSWAEPRVADFALALIHEVVAEMRRTGISPQRGWSRDGLLEVAHHVVHARLTPRRPSR